MRHQAVFFAGVVWMAVLLAVAVVSLGRARTTAGRLVALDAAVLVLMGMLALVAGGAGRPYALDAVLALALLSFVATLAAARYLGDRRPFEQPEGPGEGGPG